jgi:hypothetical protein
MSTSIKTAFTKAGYADSRETWPSEELLAVGVRAMVNHANDTEAAQHAIMRACSNDPALLRQLIIPLWRQCTAQLINEARRQIERKQRTEALETPLERRAGKVVSLMAEHDAREAAKEHREEQARIAKLDAENKAMIAAQIERWRQTRAGNFTINDKPFWQVSTFMAKQWQIRHEQGTRFVDLLLSGVPLDDRPIGHYRRPEEINALWERSLQT